jgi:hypothetical protein
MAENATLEKTGTEAAEADTSTDTETAATDDTKEREFFSDLYARTQSTDGGSGDSKTEPEPDSKEEAEPATEEAQSTPDTEAAAETKTEGESAEQPEDLDTALKASIRDGMPEEQIESWYKSDPDSFVAHGAKRAKAQADQDRFGNEYRQWLETQTGEGSTEPRETTDRQVAVESDGTSPVDIKQMINEALSPLQNEENVDLLGDVKDPIASAIATAVEAATKQVSDRFAKELASRDEAISSFRGNSVDDKLDIARYQLSAKYPQLKDPAFVQDALERYDIIVGSPGNPYDDAFTAFEESVKWASAEQRSSDIKTNLLAQNQMRKDGQPRIDTASGERELADEEKERLAFTRAYRQHFGAADSG